MWNRPKKSRARFSRVSAKRELGKVAQMEIMGLAIVVILIGLGMLFAVTFVLKKPAGDTAARVKESTLAANFLNTLLSTNTPCQERTVKELLQDCALTGGIVECPGGKSCEFAQSQIKQILDDTLLAWRKSYRFSVNGSPEVEKISFSGGKCRTDREAKVHPVPVRPGFDITLRLEICTG